MPASRRKTNVHPGIERELVITRVFDVPRELVFKAWTDVQHVTKWWGPQGWTSPVCELDVRPGGSWKILMRGPDGSEVPSAGVYREVLPPERLVFTSVAFDKDGNHLAEGLTTVTFTEHNGKTTLVLRARAAALLPYGVKMLGGMDKGWNQSLDRLGDLVAPSTTGRQLLATRLFDAPPDKVFAAWTDAQHIVQWWGPNGFTTTIYEMDVRPGGVWRFTLHGPDGVDYENTSVYVEIVRPKLIVYEHVSVPKHHATVTFEEESGKTKLTLHMLFETAQARERVVEVYRAVEGARQTLERLAELLAKS